MFLYKIFGVIYFLKSFILAYLLYTNYINFYILSPLVINIVNNFSVSFASEKNKEMEFEVFYLCFFLS